MRVFKFLLIAAFVTFFSLVYVWQQTEIFHIAYLNQKGLTCFQDLLDKNNILRYNIAKDASLVRIGNKIFTAQADFRLPDSYRLVRLEHPGEILRATRAIPKRENIVYRLFGVKRQAEARTIKPSIALPAVDAGQFTE
jgi:hypothetical protein